MTSTTITAQAADVYVDRSATVNALAALPLGARVTDNIGTVWVRTESSLGAARWRAHGKMTSWTSGMLLNVLGDDIVPIDFRGRPLEVVMPGAIRRPYTRDGAGRLVCGSCGKPVHKNVVSGWTHSLVEDYLGGCSWRNPWAPA